MNLKIRRKNECCFYAEMDVFGEGEKAVFGRHFVESISIFRLVGKFSFSKIRRIYEEKE
jgi:hypothetical protein